MSDDTARTKHRTLNTREWRRIALKLPPELYDLVEQESRGGYRTLGGQIIDVLKAHYASQAESRTGLISLNAARKPVGEQDKGGNNG